MGEVGSIIKIEVPHSLITIYMVHTIIFEGIEISGERG